MLRLVLRRVTVTVAALVTLLPVMASAQDFKVTLLGTGCPPPVMDRFGPSSLVEGEAASCCLTLADPHRVRHSDRPGSRPTR